MEYPRYYHKEDMDTNITKHPFITDVGNPTAVIASSAVANKVSFYNFKGELERIYNENYQLMYNNMVLSYFEDKIRYQKMKSLFSELGIFFNNKTGVFDRAIELGMVLDYEAMVKSYEDTMDIMKNGFGDREDQTITFFRNMYSLMQICELKVLEGKILNLFSTQIEKENVNGDISTLSAIENSTAILYYVIQTPHAFFGKHRLHDEVKKLSKIADKNLNEKQKIQLLSKYANLPLVVYKNTLENMFFGGEEVGQEEIKGYYESVNDNIMDIIDTNSMIVDAIYDHFLGKDRPNLQIDEDGELTAEYVPKENYVDPSVR